MTKNLNNRLENLENEIHVLLTLQEGGCGACPVLKGKSVTKHPNGNVERIEFEGSACPSAKGCDCQPPCSPPPCSPRACSPPSCSSPSCSSRVCSPPPCSPLGCPPLSCSSRACSPPACIPRACSPPTCSTPMCLPPVCAHAVCVPPVCIPPSCLPPSCAPPSCLLPSCLPPTCTPHVHFPPGLQPGVQCLCICGQGEAPQESCRDMLKKLCDEIKHLEGQLKKTEKEKDQAKNKSEDLRSSFQRLSQDQDELMRLKGERDELSDRLEKESTGSGSRRRSTTESEREAARREKHLKDKLCRITANVETITKKQKSRYRMLSCAVSKRDDHIRRMSDTSERLMDILAQRDLDIKKLHEDIEQAHKNLLEAENANKALADQNAALLRAIKDLQDKLVLEKNCIQKLIKYIEETKLQTCRLKEEMDSLRIRLKNALERPKEIRKFARLEAKLRESRERERLWLDEAAEMKAQLDEKEKDQEESEINYEEKVDEMYKKNKKLSEKYGEVLEENEKLKDEIDLRLCELREEYEKLLADLRRKNQKLIQIRNKTFRELEIALKEAARIRDFLEAMLAKFKELYALLQHQQDIIAEKDEYILRLLREIRALKAKIARLEREILNYKDIIEKQKAEIEALKAQIEELKALLEQLKAENAEKDKLIAEYQSKIEELNNVIAELEEQLETAKEEAEAAKSQLEKAKGEMSDLGTQLEKYTRKSKDMASEADAPEEEKLDYKMAFKQKVELMERKRELQLELVIKQKERSVEAARFSTQKLLETVLDFQNQTCVYTKIQSLLACLLVDQEDQIRAMHEAYNSCKTPMECLEPTENCGSPQCPNRY